MVASVATLGTSTPSSKIMKNLSILLFALFTAATLNAVIQEYMTCTLVGVWDVGDTVEVDAGDEALDTNPTTPGLLQSIFGDISGNTICRSDFEAAVAAAYLSGKGGVIDFETVAFDGGDWIHPGTGTTISQTGGAALRTTGGAVITIQRGDTWWYEGSAVTPYKGKQEAAFDGTGPSGPDRTNYSEIFFFTQTGSTIGTQGMGQTTVFDLDFDPVDQVVIVGFAIANYNNYQSQQDESKPWAYPNYPSLHAIATFTNGSEDVQQMAVGMSKYDSAGDPLADHYFGFEAPAGYFLKNVLFYQIGNTARAFPVLDDLGFVQYTDPGPGVLAAEDVTIIRNGTGVDVSFKSANGLLYTLEESKDLNAPWCDIQGPMAGNGGVMTFTVDPAPTDGKAFYRVRSE